MSSSILAEQFRFLSQGGIYQAGLAKMRDAGIFPLEGHYVYKEYPKLLRMDERVVEMPRVVEYCDGTKKSIVETRTVWTEVEVNSEDEEERVLSGGKTSAQIEDERQGLIQRCRNMGIPADPAWTAVRLRRELGDALDAPAPGDEMAKLEAELSSLRKMAAMREEIAQLQAQLGKSHENPLENPHETPLDDREDLRTQLADLGIRPDLRWNVARLREELEAATAPQGASA